MLFKEGFKKYNNIVIYYRNQLIQNAECGCVKHPLIEIALFQILKLKVLREGFKIEPFCTTKKTPTLKQNNTQPPPPPKKPNHQTLLN